MFNTAQRSHMTCLKRCTWHFMDWLHGTVHMPGMKTGIWLGNLPNILSEIYVLNSTITVCHPLLYHTCCINAQEIDGIIARVKTRVSAYNVPPNFHFLCIVFIVYQLYFSNPLIPHSLLAVCDNKWTKNLKQKCIARTHTHTRACPFYILYEDGF